MYKIFNTNLVSRIEQTYCCNSLKYIDVNKQITRCFKIKIMWFYKKISPNFCSLLSWVDLRVNKSSSFVVCIWSVHILWMHWNHTCQLMLMKNRECQTQSACIDCPNLSEWEKLTIWMHNMSQKTICIKIRYWFGIIFK